jgi:RES domain-containing protein
MRLWRVSRHDGLDGEGGLIVSGRWHSRGRRVVYAAEHPALAILETLVHLEIDPAAPPKGHFLFEIDLPVPPKPAVAKVPLSAFDDPAATRAIGDRWLAAAKSMALRVPSAAAPRAFNYVLNPAHPGFARARIVARTPEPFDPRLWRR